MMKNKKGIAPLLAIILVLASLLLVFYLIGFLPTWFVGTGLNSFTAKINYWFILTIYFGIQVGAIYIFYRASKYITMLVRDYKKYILQWNLKVENFLMRT
jgi:hypothetical protein